MNETILNYKDIIILAGYIVGFSYVFGILPTSTTFFGLGANVQYVYMGVILLSVYVYVSLYNGKPATGHSFQRTVDPRTMSNPQYQQDIHRQYNYPQPPPPRPQPQPVSKEDMWNVFEH